MVFTKKRAQSAIEYILIVAFALLMIIPATALFYQYSSDSQSSVINSQLFKLGNELISTAKLMYSVGEDSWQTIELTFPANILSVKVYNGTVSELVIRYDDRFVSELVFFSRNQLFNATSSDCSTGCSIPVHSGPNHIRVESGENGAILFRVIS